MEWIYKPFSYTTVIVAVGFLIKYLIQKKIDSYFNTKLEDHKKELAVMTEKAKYDISRKLFDFEAYATKKHTIYPELYNQMFEVSVELTVFTFKMENLIGVDQLDKIYDFEELDEDGIALMNEETLKLDRKIYKLTDYFKMNELFLSKETSTICRKTLKAIWDLNIHFSENEYNPYFVNEEKDNIRQEIDLLKDVMYKELSYSHFEETEEKA